MNAFLNVIIMFLETFYYSIFMKSARKEGDFKRYFLLFGLFAIITIFMNRRFLINYLIIFFLILYGLKFIVKLKITLFDLFFIILMFISKVIIEMPLSLLSYSIVENIYVASTMVGVLKVIIILLFNEYVEKIYEIMKLLWKNNNFYIRYLFSISLFIYVILSSIFLIIEWI